jgi:hypothetical protein
MSVLQRPKACLENKDTADTVRECNLETKLPSRASGDRGNADRFRSAWTFVREKAHISRCNASQLRSGISNARSPRALFRSNGTSTRAPASMLRDKASGTREHEPEDRSGIPMLRDCAVMDRVNEDLFREKWRFSRNGTSSSREDAVRIRGWRP